MDWTHYRAARPAREGWYLVHYGRSADGPGTYWRFWEYRALYWHPDPGVWTDDARPPAQGGTVVDPGVVRAIELWTEIACIGEPGEVEQGAGT